MSWKFERVFPEGGFVRVAGSAGFCFGVRRATQRVEQAIKDPKYDAERKEMFYDYYLMSFNAFLLISVDFLHRKLGFGQKRIMKFLEFALAQMQFVQEDEDYFKLLNQELEKEVGVNVLGELAKGEKHDGRTDRNED